MADETRVEKDSMGEMHVPADAYYGAQTGAGGGEFSDLRSAFQPAVHRRDGADQMGCAEVNHRSGTAG